MAPSLGSIPRCEHGTMFVTIEDETRDIQLIQYLRAFAWCQQAFGIAG